MRKEFRDMSLSELSQSQGVIQDYILRGVIAARRDGITWAGIGAQLGVTMGEAHRRYSWTEKLDKLPRQTDDH